MAHAPVLRQRSALRTLFAKRPDPYAGADPELARRILSLLWVGGAIVGAALMPLTPNAARISLLGWLLATLTFLAAVAGGGWLARSQANVPFNHMLAGSYGALVALVAAQWLTGGEASPLRELYLLTAIGGVGVHPPRRAVVFMLALGAGVASPLVYNGWSDAVARDIAGRLLLWYSLGFVVIVLMNHVRQQRVASWQSEEQARELAHVDALTGLGNRRAFEEAMSAAAQRADAGGAIASLLLLDIDQFKQINDDYGHLAGDRCLQDVAAAVSRAVREGDRCYRWGGDEVAVLLTGARADDARRLQDRIRLAEQSTCLRPDGRAMEISCGVAEIGSDGGWQTLVQRADAALLSHKRRGAATEPAL
jgi:diguanylate cyclase (GGDEF)-like protein